MRAATLVLALASLAGCGSSSSQVTAPTSLTRCAVNLAVEPGTVSATGGVGTVNVGVNRECTWEAQAGADWVVLTSARSGQGTATLSYTVAPNPLVTTRRAVITVNDSRVDVTQAAAACVYALGGQGRAFDAGGGSDRVEVRTQAGCAWTAQSTAPWIAVQSAGSGSGDGVVTISVAPNDGSARTGTVTIAAQAYQVTQDASASAPVLTPGPTPVPGPTTPTPSPTPTLPPTPTPAPGPAPAPTPTPAPTPAPVPGPTEPVPGPSPQPAPTPTPAPEPAPTPAPPPPPPPPPAPAPAPTPTPAPPPASCAYAVGPPAQAMPPEGGSGSVTVGTADGCTWTASPTAAWITLTGAVSGSGSGAVSFLAAPNPDPVPRSAAVTLAGQSATVTQPAATPVPAPCTFGVSPTAVAAAAEATTRTIEVTASAATCAWTTSGATAWLSIAPQAGTGSGQVRLTLAANTVTTPRSAAVSIAGTPVTVSQAAAAPPATPTCTYLIVPSARTLGAADTATSTTLETQAGCAWTATTTESWLAVTTPSGTGSSTIALVVTPNLTANQRTGVVTIGGQIFSVTQEGVSAVVGEIQLDGIISQVSGSCPMISFRIDGRSVRTDAGTMFVANSCARLANGADVEARGYMQINGEILATRVRVKGGSGQE